MTEPERLNRFQQMEYLYRWVGEAITKWAGLEAELANMFVWCNSPTYYTDERGMKADNYQYSLAIFNTCSFEGKTKMLKAALRQSLDENISEEETLYKEWNQILKKRISSAYKLRNKCAHWAVWMKSPNSYLVPPENIPETLANIDTETDPDRKVQTEEEVKVYMNVFMEIQVALYDLRKKMIALPGPKARWLALAQKYVDANTST